MTNVVKKVSINGQVVPFGGGGGSEGQEVVYLTQAEYDALPASKLTDGKIYKIKQSGVAPTPGGGTAVERGDMLLFLIHGSSDNVGYVIGSNYGQSATHYVFTPNGIDMNVGQWYFITNGHGFVVGASVTSKFIDIATRTEHSFLEFKTNQNMDSISAYKYNNRGIFLRFAENGTSHKEYCFVDYALNHTLISESDYETETSMNGFPYNGLYYFQDGNDYVAVDSTGAEVKRYSGVGTIDGIYDDKLYRNVDSVAYAIATI